MRPRDYRDLVIEMLADSEAALRARVSELEADVGTYRAISVAALDALERLTAQNLQLQNDLTREREAYRALREQRLLEAGADDDEEDAAAA